MYIDFDNYDRLARDRQLVKGTWEDGECRCVLSAAIAPGPLECIQLGMPSWLPDFVSTVFDYSDGRQTLEKASKRTVACGRVVLRAIQRGYDRKVDWDAVNRDLIVSTFIPMALEYLEKAQEYFRVTQGHVEASSMPKGSSRALDKVAEDKVFLTGVLEWVRDNGGTLEHNKELAAQVIQFHENNNTTPEDSVYLRLVECIRRENYSGLICCMCIYTERAAHNQLARKCIGRFHKTVARHAA